MILIISLHSMNQNGKVKTFLHFFFFFANVLMIMTLYDQ